MIPAAPGPKRIEFQLISTVWGCDCNHMSITFLENIFLFNSQLYMG